MDSHTVSKADMETMEKNEKKVYLRLFFSKIPNSNDSFVHGFVFAPNNLISNVREAFDSAHLELKFIPSYQPSHFFGVPQSPRLEWRKSPGEESEVLHVSGCKSRLMPHQIKAIQFIQRSESDVVLIPLIMEILG